MGWSSPTVVNYLNGAPFKPGTPSEARQAGIAMVFQHFSLFEALTVAENIP